MENNSRAVWFPLLLTLALILACNSSEVRAQTGASPQKNALGEPPPIKTLGALQSPAGWKRYQFGDPALFSVALPETPIAVNASDEAEGRKDIPWVHLAQSATAGYEVVYFTETEILHKQSELERATFYRNFASGFVDAIKEKLAAGAEYQTLADRRIRAAGTEGFEREFALGPLQGRMRMFFIGTSAVSLVAMWKQDSPATEREAFFNSFTIDAAHDAAADSLNKQLPPNWKHYDLCSNNFSVTLPSAPAEERNPVSLKQGTTTTAFYYKVAADDALYIFSCVPDSPSDLELLSRAQRDLFFQGFSDRMLAKLRLILQSEGVKEELKAGTPREALVGGIKGQEQDFTAGPLLVRTQFAFSHRRIFAALAVWTLATPLSVRESFFPSLKINAPAAVRQKR